MMKKKGILFGFWKRGEKGQSVVELAVFVPLVVAMILGVFEVGVAIRNYLICEEAVRAAAVQASRGLNDDQVMDTMIQNIQGLISTPFMEYSIQDFQIFPTTQQERGELGLVGARVVMRSGFYLPFMEYVFAQDYALGAVRPLHLGLQESRPEHYAAGLVPWAVQQQTYIQGSEYILRDKDSHSHGNWGAVRFPGRSGASDYEYDLTNGYTGVVSVGDVISTETGNMKMPTLRAVVSRFAGHQNETWSDYADPNEDPTAQALSPRVILIPVIKESLEDLSGSCSVNIVGFARFFLTAVYKDGVPVDLSAGGPIFEADGVTLKSGWSSGFSSGTLSYGGVYLEDGLRPYE